MPNAAVIFQGDLPLADRLGPIDWPAHVREIGNSTQHIESPYMWTIMTVEAYNDYVREHLPSYEQWKAQQSVSPDAAILKALNNARIFGGKLRDEFAKNNTKRGITVEQVSELADLLSKLNTILESGSLQTAVAELDLIPTNVSPFWTTIERDYFSLHLQSYLQGLEYKD